ncbi:MAG: hypothetical protein ACE3L7_07025 [Candidatus Pristimantibacillus sp.]
MSKFFFCRAVRMAGMAERASRKREEETRLSRLAALINDSAEGRTISRLTYVKKESDN